MPAVNEAARVLAWLSTTLGSLPQAPGGFWRGVAPLTVSSVFYGCTMEPVDDLQGVASRRIWHEGVYQIKAIGPVRGAGDYAAIVAAADAMEAVLDHAAGSIVDGCEILSCVRVRPVIYDEPPSQGVVWSHLGAYWRIRAKHVA